MFGIPPTTVLPCPPTHGKIATANKPAGRRTTKEKYCSSADASRLLLGANYKKIIGTLVLQDSVQCVGAVVNAIQSVSPLVPAVAGGVEGVAQLRTTTRPNLSHM